MVKTVLWRRSRQEFRCELSTAPGYQKSEPIFYILIHRIAWPFDADQPSAAARLSEKLHVAFELVEVRTGEAGMKPLLRNGRTAKGTREAVGAEFRKIIDDCRSQKGFEMRRKAKNIKEELAEAWSENGASRQELSDFLGKYVFLK